MTYHNHKLTFNPTTGEIVKVRNGKGVGGMPFYIFFLLTTVLAQLKEDEKPVTLSNWADAASKFVEKVSFKVISLNRDGNLDVWANVRLE